MQILHPFAGSIQHYCEAISDPDRCRNCWCLSYTSQRQDAMNRALSKAQAIRERLGGSASMAEPFPSRPEGMWWRTYYRLRATSEELWIAALMAGF